jgi:hypothetical protein
MKRRWVLLAVALFVSTTMAGELAGVSMPDRLEVEGEELVLNGLGLRKAYGFAKVYVAGLYLEERSSDANAIIASDGLKRVDMKFLRGVKAPKMTAAWEEGFEKNAGDDFGKLEERLDRLNSWIVDLKKGDVMAYTYVPGHGVTMTINGEDRGTIEGADFARALWSVWLGPEPPNEGLKTGMLGE